MLAISSQFDSGAITVLRADDPANIELHLRGDSHADFAQWFHFRLTGARGQACTLRILNAGQAAYPRGWPDYRAVASNDRKHWFRVPTDYADGVLTIRHTPDADSVYYAYFEPYSWERHLDLLGRVARSPRVAVERLCSTAEGRDVDLVRVRGAATARRKVWVIARQHPGESMAEWLVEGLLDRLLDEADAAARAVLALAEVCIVPNMNPDGSVRGNLRTSATGANLNREWMAPSAERSPEVLAVRARLIAGGVDAFFDIHGDEALPYVFVAGCEMLPGFTPEQAQAQHAFIAALKHATPDFQDRYGYSADRYHQDALKLASKWVGDRFGCLSLTLEMPFKDNADHPDPVAGWSAARSKGVGAALLLALAGHLRRLEGMADELADEAAHKAVDQPAGQLPDSTSS